MLLFERNEHTPMYQSLYRALREEIISGQRRAGEKLPSKRVMAQTLGISVNTVDAAYSQLALEGFVSAKARSGFVVCPIDAVQAVSLSQPVYRAPKPEPPFAVDFNPSGMAKQQFPLSVWQRITKEVLATRQWLNRCPPQGDPGLREAIAEYLHKARNVRCTPEQIVIGSGTENLVTMLSMLVDSDVSFAVENPLYNHSYHIFARMGHPVLAAQVDKQGVMVEPLEQLERVMLYTTPSHQYPLGICMPMARRARLLNWCAQGQFRYIIEDDYDSEFRYDARPVPSLQSIDGNERTVYLGTFSQTVAPSLRIGYMVLPPALLEQYRASALGFSCSVPVTEQMILREFMAQGYFEKHLNRMRTYYKKQRKILVDALSVFGAELRVIGESAGHHVTVQVRNGMDEAQLCQTAAKAGVRVYPISTYFIGAMPKQFRGKLLLGFGDLSAAEIADGVERLYSAWHHA